MVKQSKKKKYVLPGVPKPYGECEMEGGLSWLQKLFDPSRAARKRIAEEGHAMRNQNLRASYAALRRKGKGSQKGGNVFKKWWNTDGKRITQRGVNNIKANQLAKTEKALARKRARRAREDAELYERARARNAFERRRIFENVKRPQAQEGKGFSKRDMALLAGNLIMPGLPIPYPGQTEMTANWLKDNAIKVAGGAHSEEEMEGGFFSLLALAIGVAVKAAAVYGAKKAAGAAIKEATGKDVSKYL